MESRKKSEERDYYGAGRREYWLKRAEFYKQPYFRVRKCAKIANAVSRRRNCDLLDVGCGPATLSRLLDNNISYYGLALVIHEPAPNLRETDLRENEIAYESKKFDIIIAAGFFELLKRDGTFITTFTNFRHVRIVIEPGYSNIKSIEEFKRDLSSFFVVERCFPSSHNWSSTEPTLRLLNALRCIWT